MNETPAQDGAESLAPHVRAAKSALRFTFSRSSGPGGQSVNKVSSRAQLRLALADIEGMDADALDRLRRLAGARLTNEDELLIDSDVHRSQKANRRECLGRLRTLIEQAMVKPLRRRKVRPSRAMIERRLEAKKRRAEKKARRSWRQEH